MIIASHCPGVTEILLKRTYYCRSSSLTFYQITLHSHWGTRDDFTTIPFHLLQSSTSIVYLEKSIIVLWRLDCLSRPKDASQKDDKTKRREKTKRQRNAMQKKKRRNNTMRKDETCHAKDEFLERKDEKTYCEKTPFETLILARFAWRLFVFSLGIFCLFAGRFFDFLSFCLALFRREKRKRRHVKRRHAKRRKDEITKGRQKL